MGVAPAGFAVTGSKPDMDFDPAHPELAYISRVEMAGASC